MNISDSITVTLDRRSVTMPLYWVSWQKNYNAEKKVISSLTFLANPGFQHCIWCWCVSFWVAIRPIWVICRKIDILWVCFNWTDSTYPYIETNYTRKSVDYDCLALFSCWRQGSEWNKICLMLVPNFSAWALSTKSTRF